MKIITQELGFVPESDIRSICSPEEMLLFDIETTGLKKETTQLYLIGCAFLNNGAWTLRQYLTENVRDEERVLLQFLEFASSFKTLVHFNGDGFDIPYLRYKTDYYGAEDVLSGLSGFDIYRHAKRARKLLGLSSMSQKSVEQFLGVYREDQMDGGSLISVYFDYEKTGDQELERLLLLHNADDLKGMLKILPILSYSYLLEGGYSFESLSRTPDTAVFSYRLKHGVPVAIQAFPDIYGPDSVRINARDHLLEVIVKIRKGTGKIPVPDPENYYYLPEEDRVIHRDVAQFVDRSRRRKATKKTGFLKKEGEFIPASHPADGKCYFLDDFKKQTFADFGAFSEENRKDAAMILAGDIMEKISSC